MAIEGGLRESAAFDEGGSLVLVTERSVLVSEEKRTVFTLRCTHDLTTMTPTWYDQLGEPLVEDQRTSEC